MKTLAMDTTHKYLVLGLFDGDKLVASTCKDAWKRQSEELFPALVEIMERASWEVDDLDEVVITRGPGSYTGARISMAVAKVLANQKKLDLYTISTFEMYAGKDEALVILDARVKRVYAGYCKDGKLVEEEIIEIEDLKKRGFGTVLGDSELLGLVPTTFSRVENFMDVRDAWVKVDNIHALAPHYLKEQDACAK